MTITLTPELESLVNEAIMSGEFDSPDAVLRASLLRLKEGNLSREEQRENLRREIQKGIDAIRDGKSTSYDSADEMIEDVIKEARADFESRKNNGV